MYFLEFRREEGGQNQSVGDRVEVEVEGSCLPKGRDSGDAFWIIGLTEAVFYVLCEIVEGVEGRVVF